MCEKFLDSHAIGNESCAANKSEWNIISLVFSVDRLERFRDPYKTTLLSWDFCIWREFYNVLPTEVFLDIMELKDTNNLEPIMDRTNDFRLCPRCDRSSYWYCCQKCQYSVCCAFCFHYWRMFLIFQWPNIEKSAYPNKYDYIFDFPQKRTKRFIPM